MGVTGHPAYIYPLFIVPFTNELAPIIIIGNIGVFTYK